MTWVPDSGRERLWIRQKAGRLMAFDPSTPDREAQRESRKCFDADKRLGCQKLGVRVSRPVEHPPWYFKPAICLRSGPLPEGTMRLAGGWEGVGPPRPDPLPKCPAMRKITTDSTYEWRKVGRQVRNFNAPIWLIGSNRSRSGQPHQPGAII